MRKRPESATVPARPARLTLESLAVLSNQPAFPSPVHVGRPNVSNRDRFFARLNDIFDRRWFTNAGPVVAEFEHTVADLLGVRHCVATCNGTVALELAIRGLDLRGEVIVPSFTFVATAHALQWQEITPVFCDVDPHTHAINPDNIETLITPRTTGIIGVHLWGGACKTTNLEQIAEKHGLRLLFDASHAFACRHRNRHIGTFGNAEVFSFHATKFIHTFEGGAIVTNDDTLARRLRLMKNFGFAGYDSVVYLGVNGKMSEVSAAMGLTMIEDLDSLREDNRLRYELYKFHLGGLQGVRFVDPSADAGSNFQYVVVELDEREAGIDRDTLMKVLHAENVLARRYFYPGCHRMEPYRSYYPHASLLLPVTEEICKKVLVLPTGPTLAEDDILLICGIMRTAIEGATRLREQLGLSTQGRLE